MKNSKVEIGVWCCAPGADPKGGYLYARFHLAVHALEWAEAHARECFPNLEMVVLNGKFVARYRGTRPWPENWTEADKR